MRSLCLSFLFFVLTLAVVVPASWPSAAQDKGTFAAQMLAEHNAVRQKFGVQPLVWDEGLAKLAQEWADKIAAAGATPPAHRASGQNLFWGTADQWSPKDVLEVWEAESKNYDRATNTCAPGKFCVHFTQVVWWTTTRVGCGKAKGMSKGEATDFIVCDYSPPGNEVGKSPFPTSLTPPLTATLTPTGTPPTATTTPIVTPSPVAPPVTPAPSPVAPPVTPAPTPVTTPVTPAPTPVTTPVTPAPTPVTPPVTPAPIPRPAPTPNTNTECEDLRKNQQRLTAWVEQLSKQIGESAKLRVMSGMGGLAYANGGSAKLTTPAPTPTPIPVARKVTTGAIPRPTATPITNAESEQKVQNLTAQLSKNDASASTKTTLLYPFVSNQAGFDTEIAISNTSADTMGTKPQTGNCTLYYYGPNGGGAPPAQQTTVTPLSDGQTAVFTLSSGGTNGIAATPGFQGYAIARCDFRYTHGFAYVSDVGSQRLVHSYLATDLTPATTPVTTPVTPTATPDLSVGDNRPHRVISREGHRYLARVSPPAPTPNTNTECEDLRKNVQRLTAEVQQFSKQIGESAKLQTPTPVATPIPVTTKITTTPIPAPAPTPNTNTECEDLRKNVRRLSAEEELLSAQLGDYAPPIPFARQIFSAPTSEFTIPTPKPTPRVPVPCYRFVLGGKTRLDHSNQYGIEFMQIPASATIKSFCMGKYEVTEAQWQAVMGSRTVGFDSGGGRILMGSRNWPVQAVTWFDARDFINKLNGLNDGWMYRLPTEAEWEYAARAGTTGNYAGNLSEIAWYGANSGGQAHAVGGKQPNAWGLYDMIGNVFEMSKDEGTLTRIGGSYASPAEEVGGPVRYSAPPASHELTMHGDDRDGFRVVAVPR